MRKRDKTVWISAATHRRLKKIAKQYHLSISSLADIMLAEVLEMFGKTIKKRKKINEDN